MKLLFLLCRKVPAAPRKPPADIGGSIFGDLQPGADVLAKPGEVRPLPHLQSGEYFLCRDPTLLLYILTKVSV